jgi:hypothetical protein
MLKLKSGCPVSLAMLMEPLLRVARIAYGVTEVMLSL